ncbi:MAG: YopN family type III secretion system gatekeeper subunit [Waddliaceae bacterium]|nr:YopN family type III secretion system gatekeeper subunit [Waddliaceae bacterium]
MAEIRGPESIHSSSAKLDQLLDDVQEKADLRMAKQDWAQDTMKDMMMERSNPFARKIREKKRLDKENKLRRLQKAQESGDKTKKRPVSKHMQQLADKFAKRNHELGSKNLLLLREQLKEGMDPEEILEKVQEFFEDVSLADEALEFLEEGTTGELGEAVRKAKDELNSAHKTDITAGKNIRAKVREFSEKGLGSPTALRDMYRDLIHNPRPATQLFEEFATKFNYKQLSQVCKFLFHSLGADLKSKGASIPRGLLSNLIRESRTLQAVLGVYRFFFGRMNLVRKQFEDNGLTLPKQCTFETMARQFMRFAAERYPTPDKLLRGGKKLRIDDWTQAKIIVFSQMRDAVRQMALDLIYKSVSHRDEVLQAIIELLEDLEAELEELEVELEKEELEGKKHEDKSKKKKRE